MKTRKAGASLLEMLITIALFSVVLMVIGSLMNGAARVSRRADSLSWANQASGWLDRIELDVASANSLSVAPGAGDTSLEIGLRTIDAPAFLPTPPPDPWKPDNAVFLKTREYKIVSEKLVLLSTAGGTSVTEILGPATAFEVGRAAEGDLTVVIKFGDHQVRREVAPLLIDSERAPF